MATPSESFAESTGEAVQASAMAVRLILAIADAARRAAEERAGRAARNAPPPLPEVSMGQAAGDVKSMLPLDIATALMAGADWPLMAQQLADLQAAGVDMGLFLPRVAEVAVTVRDAVAAKTVPEPEPAGEWARLLRETMPAGPVREAILASPSWPDIAASMARLQESGVDVRQVLAVAYTEGAGAERTVSGGTPAAQPRIRSRDALRIYGPLSVDLDLPADLDLSDRGRALAQLGVSRAENQRFVRTVQEALTSESAREASTLVMSRQWPLVAARMAKMSDAGLPVADHLARLATDRGWEHGPTGQLAARLLRATNEALCRPPLASTGCASAAGGVSTSAARAQSPNGPTRPLTVDSRPVGPGGAHGVRPVPARTRGRTR